MTRIPHLVKGVSTLDTVATDRMAFTIVGVDGTEHSFALDSRTLEAFIALLLTLAGRRSARASSAVAPDPAAPSRGQRRRGEGSGQRFAVMATEDGALTLIAEDGEYRMHVILGPRDARELQAMLHEVTAKLAEQFPAWRLS